MSKAIASVGKISRPGDRWPTRRSLHHGNPAAMRRHNERVGAVLHAYNSAHSYVYATLMSAASGDSHQATKELWFSLGSDKSQREFVLNYVRNNQNIKTRVRNALIWALTALSELSTLRNDIAHTDMIWAYDKLEAGYLAKDPTRRRFESQPFDENWRYLKGDFSALSNYIMDLSWDVALRNSAPSSRRPRLRLSRGQDSRTQDRKRRSKKKAQQRQRRSP